MKLSDIQPRVVRLLGMTEPVASEAQRKAHARYYERNRERLRAAERERHAKRNAA